MPHPRRRGTGTLNIDPAKVKEAINNSSAQLNCSYRPKPSSRSSVRPSVRNGFLAGDSAGARLAVVEDAAHAPANYKGRTIGSHAAPSPIPVMTCFSFYATKKFDDGRRWNADRVPEAVEEARAWSLHGMNRDAWKGTAPGNSWYYEVTRRGSNTT